MKKQRRFIVEIGGVIPSQGRATEDEFNLVARVGAGRPLAMEDFVVRTANRSAVFRFGVDFTEGERRLCWTATGIEKLIELGLWRREFDNRGNLKSKPIRVEAAMRLAIARALPLDRGR